MLLSEDSLTINSLADNFEMSRPAVSKHIKILYSAGFISIQDIGRERYCTLKKDGFEDRTLFFSIKNHNTGQHFSTHHVVDFGKGWTTDSVIMHLSWGDVPEASCCQA